MPEYARSVSLDEIRVNDFNLNIRRYVDTSPPPEPHDVRAHLHGGVPVAEVEAKSDLYEYLGFDPYHVFVPRESDNRYLDFKPSLSDRSTLRSLVESDSGIQARTQALRTSFVKWWAEHSWRLTELPERRDLNTVRAEFLDSFVNALEPLGVLDHFKLAGVIASWWAETLADLKTLLENGFPGVIDGWIDTVADALEDDESTGPDFDPFGHKLVRAVMADVVEKIAAAKADIARIKGEKEAFDQSNPPEEADEEELASWNYARDLERQIKELKGENREALKELSKLERAANKARASDADNAAVKEAKDQLQPFFSQLADLNAALAPYEEIKKQLSAARNRYRELVATFVDQLKARCAVKTDDEKQILVLDLMAKDLETGLDVAVSAQHQELIWFLENLWDKYRVTLNDLQRERASVEESFESCLKQLGFS